MKKIILSAVLVVFLFGVNSSCAISAQQTEISLEKQTTNEQTNVLQGEQPAVDSTAKKKKWFRSKGENIVPVADLEGSVDITPVEAETGIKPYLEDWLQGDYATGDWGGFRTKLEEHGVAIEAVYLSDAFQKLYGGIQKSKYPVRHFGVIDTAILLDTEKMGLWKGGQAAVRFQHKFGMGLNEDYIGAYQYLDAYDDRQFNQVSEYWYEQGLFNNKIQVKLGKQDACYDFMALDLATNFVNNSHAYFMPNVPLPAYPEPALGAVLKINPTDWLSLRTGWYDAKAKGGTSGFGTAFGGDKASFLIQEIGIRHNAKNMPGTILAGGWLHTAHVEELSNNPHMLGQSMGWYVESEQMVWKENKDNTEDNQGLYTLAQLSLTPANRSEISSYYGASLMYKGLIPNRDEDVLALGVASAKFSDRLKAMASDGRRGLETIIEAFYKIQVTPWFSLQPVTQVILRPDADRGNTAFAFGLRSVISF